MDGAGRRGVFVELVGEPAALAVVGLGQVDELEIEAERTCELVGSGKIKGAYTGERLLEVSGRGGGVCRSALRGFRFAPGDGSAAKSFDGVVSDFARRLAGWLAYLARTVDEERLFMLRPNRFTRSETVILCVLATLRAAAGAA